MKKSDKSTILHLVTDIDVGGVKTALDVLLNSRLSQKFNFFTLFTKPSIAELQQNSQKPDLIVVHTACSWAMIPKLFALRRFGKLAIYEHHYNDVFEEKVPSLFRFRWMLRLCYGISDRTIAVSQAQANWMKKHRLVSPKKLRVITPARSLDQMLAVPEISSAPSSLSLGTYGRFSVEKGFDLLIEAMKIMPTLSPDVAVNLYIGGYGDLETQLKTQAQNVPAIEFVGMVHDVAQFLEKCDVIVIPSRRETWGIVCMEAKAAARPTIATTVGGLVEQIVVGEAPNPETDFGILVPPENPEALAQAIAMVGALSKDDLRAWGRRSREAVRNTLEVYIAKWEELILDVLKR
jgi:glycosyltransferase involved in cell wall biosynthesis